MNAAYKQEKKKNSKRKTHNNAPLGLKITDPLFAAEDSPCPKKLKDNLFLSFPEETVLSTGQSGASGIKSELSYHLDEPDVRWAGQQVVEAATGHMWYQVTSHLWPCHPSPREGGLSDDGTFTWWWAESTLHYKKGSNLFTFKLSWNEFIWWILK